MGGNSSKERQAAEQRRQVRELQEKMKLIEQRSKEAAVENEKRRAEEERRHKEEIRLEVQRVEKENELRKAQEELRHKEKIAAEVKRVEAEAEARRARDEVIQLKRDQEIQEKFRRDQEEKRRLEDKIRMEEEKRKLNEHARKIEEEARERVDTEACLRREAERNLENGIPPVKYPTGDDIRVVRERLQYQQGNLHIAISGVSGSGKSSLINAFRGYSSKHLNAAKQGVCETTGVIGRYCDPARPWMFWYDVPGAGTLKVPDWQYFNDQGLYIFDIIIIAVDIRFTKTDAALLLNCKRFGIPVFVVRSKADQHIDNIMKEDCESSDEGDDDEYPQNTSDPCAMARNKFVTATRQGFAAIIQEAELPPQKAYIVSKDAIRSVVKGSKTPVDLIDEMDLIGDILHAANERYHQGRYQSQPT